MLSCMSLAEILTTRPSNYVTQWRRKEITFIDDFPVGTGSNAMDSRVLQYCCGREWYISSTFQEVSVFTLVLEIFLNCYRDEEMSNYCKNITRA